MQQRGTVSRGGGKPAHVYELTPEAEEDLFSKAYRPVLRQILGVMAELLGLEETEALLRAVGRRMADGRTVPTMTCARGSRWPSPCSVSWVALRSSKSTTVLSLFAAIAAL